MTAVRPAPSRARGATVPTESRGGLLRRAPGTAVLAVIGVLDIAFALFSWGRWLASGPAPVTRYRDPGDLASFWTARFYEGLIAIAVVALTIYLVRACLRQRRLVFDAVIVIGGFFTLFWDPMVNWLQPNFFYSSQWLNLNTWVGETPFVVNPVAGTMPQPVFIMFVYPFGLLAFAMIVDRMMWAVRRVRPGIGTIGLVGTAFVGGGLMGMVLEAPAFLTHLWALPGAPAAFSLFGNGHRYPWAEYLTTAIVFATFASMRHFRTDAGETLAERGTSHLRPTARAAVSVLVVTAAFAMSMWALILVQIPAGMHASPYPRDYPDHLVNDLCSIRADQPTAYGPCPGSPGFRLPIAQTFSP